MREYALSIPLSYGLRPYGANKNSEYLVQCHNVKVWSDGLREYEPVTDPLTAVWAAVSLHTAWPFRYIYIGKKHNFAITSKYVYLLDSDLDVVVEVVYLDIEPATKISVVDYGDYILICNGAKTYGKTILGTWSAVTLDAVCLCDFKGQVIRGGPYGFDTDFVMWTKIGSIDITMDMTNDAGYMPTGVGNVYDVRRLGDYVLVCGDGGVVALRPIKEPTVGFGLINLLKAGILGIAAVGGGGDDSSPVLLISEFGEAWIIKPDLSMENLGFVEFFSALGADTVVTYSAHDGVFYISDGVVSYMLTRYGLSSICQCVVNVTNYGGVNVSGVVPLTDVAMYAKTEPLDLGLRSIKSIQCVELDAIGSGFTMDLYSDTQMGGSLYTLANQPVNPLGVCTSKISGINFAFKVQNPTYVGKLIKGLMLRYKLTDKRFLRGPYADQTTAGTNRKAVGIY